MFGCHWFCHVVHFLGWLGGCVSCLFFVSRGSEHVEYPENNFKLGGNLTEWHSTGLSPGSVPGIAFSARSMCVCLVVTGLVMFCPFSGLVGWLCQLPFLFPGVPSMSNTPKIISNLGSLLEAFPALHSFFLFLPFSFQQEACVYVLSAVGLWDSAWQMANLPDRSKCINYDKIRWFWNAMIYLY